MIQNSFLERLAHDRPHQAVKYMSHLATQIQGDNYDSAKSQAIYARMERDFFSVAKACDRESALRMKFMELAVPFFEQHAVVGTFGDAGQARDIFDVIHKEPLSREYLMSTQ